MPAFAAADGTELAYHVHGTGAPLVCVPGGPMQDPAYLGDLGGLAAYRQLIMLNLRGTGKSAIPRIRQLPLRPPGGGRLRAAGSSASGRFDLLGHSAGANIAVQYAVRHHGGWASSP